MVPLGDHADGEHSRSIAAYLELLQAEINGAPAGPPLSTVYVGGGTPSMLSPGQLRQLLQALTAVAREAKQVPGPTFQTLWRGNLTGFYRTSADPLQQAEAFRANRRAVCAYAKSVGFQGTGYGISTTRCELALTRTLLDELKP